VEEHGVDGDSAHSGEIVDDALGLGIEIAGNHGEEVTRVEFLRHRHTEQLIKGDLKRVVRCVLGVDAENVFMRQVLDPGAVVEGLGNNIARRPIAPELENVDSSVTVECEQVDVLPVGRRDLTADQEERLSEHGRISLNEILETLLARHSRGEQPLDSVVKAPESDVERHGVPFLSVVKKQVSDATGSH
jgi:hypothetical protein